MDTKITIFGKIAEHMYWKKNRKIYPIHILERTKKTHTIIEKKIVSLFPVHNLEVENFSPFEFSEETKRCIVFFQGSQRSKIRILKKKWPDFCVFVKGKFKRGL